MSRNKETQIVLDGLEAVATASVSPGFVGYRTGPYGPEEPSDAEAEDFSCVIEICGETIDITSALSPKLLAELKSQLIEEAYESERGAAEDAAERRGDEAAERRREARDNE